MFDPATLTERTDVPLVAQRRVVPDAAVSTADQTVYVTSQIVNDADGNLVDGTTARYGFDGHTSQMVDCCNSTVNGVPIDDFSGLMPLKFGFGVEKKDYLYYDDTIRQATTAKYVGTEQLDGVTVYKFEQIIPPTQVGTLEVPGPLVGLPHKPAYTGARYYSNTRTMWVEPTTGVIVNGSEDQLQVVRSPNGGPDLTLIAGTLAFTPENIAGSLKQAKDGKSQLDLVTKTLPVICLLLGLLALVGGWLLLRRRSDAQDTPEVREPVSQPV